jgi:hypothetical protein
MIYESVIIRAAYGNNQSKKRMKSSSFSLHTQLAVKAEPLKTKKYFTNTQLIIYP